MILVAYVLLTVWWSWPNLLTWTSTVALPVGGFAAFTEADFYLNLWALSWESHALLTNPLALFDGNTFFPAKLTVAYSEHLLAYVPLFAPVYWTTGNPVLAFNVTSALTYPLSAIAMYLFARLYVGVAAAALGGFFYAFTIARFVTPPHIQSLGVQFFPLILLASEQWLRRARTRDAVLLAVALVLQALSSGYLLYAVLLMACPYGAAAAWHHRARLDRRRVVGLLVVGGVATLLIAAAMWPCLVLRDQGLMVSYDEERSSLALSPYFARLFLSDVLLAHGIGWTGYALGAVGILLARSARERWPKRLALLLVVVGCVAALGPRLLVGGVALWSPYLLLRDYVPGFASVRLPGRFAVIAQLGLALLAALGADQLLRRLRGSRALLAGAAIAALALALMRPFPSLTSHDVPVGDAIPPAYHCLREKGEGHAVLELPHGTDANGRARRAYLSTAHWQPILEGYAGNAPVHWAYVYWIANALPARSALQRIVDLVDVGWILVHRDELDARRDALWTNELRDGLEPVGEWDGDILYRVVLQPLDDRRARLLSSTETVNGVPIEPIVDDCAGALEMRAWGEPPTRGAPARAEVAVVNRSQRTWPAFGFLPRNLVAMEAQVLDERSRSFVEPWPIRLNDDVAPGTEMLVAVRFVTPRLVGRYRVRVRLVQPGSGSLDHCVAPLEIPFDVEPATEVAAAERDVAPAPAAPSP